MVRPIGERYQLIHGERRWRDCTRFQPSSVTWTTRKRTPSPWSRMSSAVT
jgi:hypothetical protein